MLKIRMVKTASQSQAVQLVYYKDRKRVIYKHIGSVRTEEELKEGFPIGYEVFAGNTFEGHTILPVIRKFIIKIIQKNSQL